MTGQEEIEAAIIEAKEAARLIENEGYCPLKIYPLYSALPRHKQLEALKAAPPGTRKMIFTTNIAETSITIGGS